MDVIAVTTELMSQGRFVQALRSLDAGTVRGRRVTGDVLRTELLERIGHHGRSEALAEQLLKSKSTEGQERAACEFVLARIQLEAGRSELAILNFQRAISSAQQAGDIDRVCWSQIRLMSILSERSVQQATGALLSEVRHNAAKAGNAHIFAALHIYAGERDAKRGLLESANRHTRLGQEFLAGTPNVWLEATAENTHLAVAILRSEFDNGLKHGRLALDFAEQSGAAGTLRACLGNLGNLYLMVGDFEQAVSYFERAIAALPSLGDNTIANLDSLAKTRLSQGLLGECSTLLDRIERSIQSDSDRLLYAHRYSRLTRTLLAAREKQWDEALRGVAGVMDLAASTQDERLGLLASLAKAEILQEAGSLAESLTILNGAIQAIPGQQPEMYCQYERILACGLTSSDMAGARRHFERARRIYQSVGSATGIIELDRRWSDATVDLEKNVPAWPDEPDADAVGGYVAQSVASLLLHAARPELLVRELIQLLEATGCIKQGVAFSQANDEGPELLECTKGASLDSIESAERKQRFVVSANSEQKFEIVVEPKPDVESVATLNAVTILLNTIHELERGRAEREDRATLWPIEELPVEHGNAILTGHMREVMGLARRIATTNVTVLITGESGTGKEIIARALHAYSARADKPFIPFNCAAIPHDMLESQLFGHRRGSFTGADRDQPGVIRSARDGTLFLDEIGEMGIDLQPKILRFLESGEIAPLGEPGPITVPVRLVAATNANLETLVRSGRFREDLYYRLNVFRLTIRPLRERRDEIPSLFNAFVIHAAVEFRKGQMRIAEETMEHLILYPWPGNVRQLLNETRRMVALAEPNSVLTPADISTDIRATLPAFPTLNADGRQIAVPLHDKLLPTLSKIEREMIRLALRDHGGRVDAAAKALGISRKGLYLKRQRLGL
jgi:DNA-binding NtrC family response regulator/tetratricopeptide (TPR) repeat protein